MRQPRDDVATTIGSLDVFASCTRGERDLVTRMATLTDVGHGAVLCSEGDPGRNFYVLVQGEALVTIDGRDVASLGPGCAFGEIALLKPRGRRMATVVTSQPARLLVFSRPEFATVMAEVPRLAHEILDECRRRLDATADGDGPWVTS